MLRYHETSEGVPQLQIHILVKCFNCSPWIGYPEVHEDMIYNKYYYLYNPV